MILVSSGSVGVSVDRHRRGRRRHFFKGNGYVEGSGYIDLKVPHALEIHLISVGGFVGILYPRPHRRGHLAVFGLSDYLDRIYVRNTRATHGEHHIVLHC